MSIIIIAFPGAPKVDPEALRKEEELNKLIKQKVTGNFICIPKQVCQIKKFKDRKLVQKKLDGSIFKLCYQLSSFLFALIS